MTLPADAIENDPPPSGGGTIFTPYRITQFFVLIASVVSILLFWWAGKSLGIPAERGFDVSVLQQPHWFLVLVSIYVLLVVCLILGTLISGRWWFFGGLFAALVGLGALSVAGGPMRYVLFDAQMSHAPQHVYIRLAVETFLLFIPIGLAWVWLWRQYDVALPATTPGKTSAAQMPIALAVAAQVIISGLIVLLFCATDAKKEAVVSVFLAGLIGTALADYVAPHPRAAQWYWIGPLAAGVIGYLLSYFNATPWTNGSPIGALAALARPLPLDYAGAGAAGALLGYWVATERPRVRFSLRKPNDPPSVPAEPAC